MILQSVITCPHCAATKPERMPTDACRFFYTCTGCGVTLRPKPGDCCVFCSYGSVPCPPVQAENSGERGAASCCRVAVQGCPLSLLEDSLPEWRAADLPVVAGAS